ncbi:MAG: signal peptide peptidase SppA [Pseudomonadales bacterium]
MLGCGAFDDGLHNSMQNNDAPRSRWARFNDGISRARIIAGNLVFLIVVAFLLVWFWSGGETVAVPDDAALVINPQGAIVERPSITEPLQEWLAPGRVEPETALRDVLTAIERGAQDARIRSLVLDLEDLSGLSTAHAAAIGNAVAAFREAGKEVVAYGSYYTQAQYLIASYADAIYMHPFGQLTLQGFGINELYFKDLLDKLRVTVNVFRVGKYKEFVEPYTRTGMSDDAREANQALVDTLWSGYSDVVRHNRQIDAQAFDRYTQAYDQALTETDGDTARLALEYGLVDELMTPDQVRVRIADSVGYDEQGNFNGIDFASYLEATRKPPHRGDGQIAVITGEGAIVTGDQPRGVIAAERMVGLIREARRDDKVRALVLRLNTPGGSSFASELVRQELELTQLAGKPVVVSMGPVTASGGYWIASTADRIVAEPDTITGSIGVFGIVPTFEQTLDWVGVHTDGVRTSPLAGDDITSGLGQATASVMQASVESTYQRFIQLVARGRSLSPERVDEIAQGRVWLGSKALDLGLVDALGDREAAIAEAGKLAGLDSWQVREFEQPLTARELLLRALTNNLSLADQLGAAAQSALDARLASLPFGPQMRSAWQALSALTDPKSVYALCEACLDPGVR